MVKLRVLLLNSVLVITFVPTPCLWFGNIIRCGGFCISESLWITMSIFPFMLAYINIWCCYQQCIHSVKNAEVWRFPRPLADDWLTRITWKLLLLQPPPPLLLWFFNWFSVPEYITLHKKLFRVAYS